jgi:hypothetical protein
MKILLLFSIIVIHIFMSTSLHAQWDLREQIVSTPSDPLVATNIIKGLVPIDVEYMGMDFTGGPVYTTESILDVATLEAAVPSAVVEYDSTIFTPWANYIEATPFYYLDPGPKVAITVPVGVPPYPATYGWVVGDVLTLEVTFNDPQVQSTVDEAAIEAGLVTFIDTSVNNNSGELEFTSLIRKVKVSNETNATTFSVDTIAPYPDFYGVNMTGYLDYPTNAVPNARTLKVVESEAIGKKIINTRELLMVLINTVKNNIARIEALEVFHP